MADWTDLSTRKVSKYLFEYVAGDEVPAFTMVNDAGYLAISNVRTSVRPNPQGGSVHEDWAGLGYISNTEGGAGGVATFNSRNGNVVPLSADYETFYEPKYQKLVLVTSPNDMAGPLDSSSVYFLDGVIDFTGSGVSVEIPAGGLTIKGHSFDISKMICSDSSYTMFTSPVGGSGNLLGVDYAVEVTGANSQVYDITDATGFNAFELSRVNYNDCTSLGEITDYRQGFESGTGRFGGAPELTLSGTWLGGYFIDSSIVRSLDAGMTGSLFKAGTAFQMNSRFRSNMNTDLPALASYADFQPSQFPNASTVQIDGAIISRNGVFDANDSNLFPNMAASDLSSAWSGNTGLDNTYVGGINSITTEVDTVINTTGVYEDLNGVYTASNLVHFDSPNGNDLRHLGSSPRDFIVSVKLVVDGPPNDDLELAVVMWDDSASQDVEIVTERRRVDNVLGGNDVAYFSVSYPYTQDKNDRVRLRIRNNSGTGNLAAEIDSFVFIRER